MRPTKLLRYLWNHPLNTGSRLSGVGRMLRWQLASRLMPGPIALPFVDDTYLLASRGMSGATGSWYYGLHEAQEMGFVLHLLRPGDHFLDVGANIGSYSILAANVCRVTAVEPIPKTFQHLLRNIQLNGFNEKVCAHNVGLSDRKTILRFTSELDCVNHVATAVDVTPSIDVPVTTLDELIGNDVPAVIKIDVEGHERAVLLGAKRTLADSRVMAVIMEINGSGNRYGLVDEELIQMMADYGFSRISYDPIARRLFEEEHGGENTIFIRDRGRILNRVNSARRFRLVNTSI
jgi:FkbM family methyltransferase